MNLSILLIFTVGSITINSISGLVPKVCVHNVSSTLKTCCPIPDGFHQPCGGVGRGVCDKVYTHWEPIARVFKNDDRMHWPTRFFKRMCNCEGNFFGIACESCWYGWEGRNCDRRVIKIRRNIFSFSELERMRFLRILEISNKMPSEFLVLEESSPEHSDPLVNPVFFLATFQEFIAFIHRYASRSTLFANKQMCSAFGYLDYNHNTVSFATWHRALMLHWERELAKIAMKEFQWKDFAIPYWDWLDAKKCEVCNNRYVGATGKYDYQNPNLVDRRRKSVSQLD
uniref:Tyrosinase n=1 Tax=Schmidtea mediterranea TaxID=79327 RepID=A0A1W6I192_SCHMD|nr:tyrosinase precursor-like protein [Schmidtea mediterranea]